MKQLYYALQTIIRGRDSSVIKITSLSLGLLLSVILFARVAFELNYDNFYGDIDRLFLVNTAWGNENGVGEYSPYNIYPTAETIARHFPEQVESYTTVSDFTSSTFKHGVKKYKGKVVMADSLYFQTMGVTLYEGNALDLGTPEVIFLSQSLALEIFGSENPIGKTLTYPIWGKDHSVIVKGIFADTPENSSLGQIRAVVSINSMQNFNKGWNGGGNYLAFIRLKHKEDAAVINQKINDIIGTKYFPREHYSAHNLTGIEVTISPLRDRHLENKDVKRMIYIMMSLAFAILLTATLNYVLISLSSLSYRAKSIGVHKCNGASMKHILGMFLWETAFIIGISLLLITFFILNFSNKIEELTETSLDGLFSLQNLWAPAIVILFLFIVGGILPGKTFSSIPVTQVFCRYTENKKRWKYPLLFFQFGGAAFLAGIMCVVFVQYHHIMSKDLGYDMSRVAFLYHDFEHPENAIGNLHNLPYIESVATSDLDMLESRSPFSVNDNSGNHLFSPRMNWFDTDFFSFIDLKLKAGEFPKTKGQILVNQEFVKKMGWQGSGVGEIVPEHGTVTGIIEGYYFTDVAEMPPFEIQIASKTPADCIHVRLKEPFEDNLQRLNADMKKLYPQDEIIFKSYKENLRQIFHTVRIFRDSTLLASMVILAITLMGLIGYTNDEVRRRSKEIAIRKINGAEINSILRLLSCDITYIAVPAVLLGVILSNYVGNIWLVQFNDMLQVSPLLYIGTAGGILLFIIGCVIFKSWHIANENPVLSIKNE